MGSDPTKSAVSGAECPIERTAGVDWFRAIISGDGDPESARYHAEEIQEQDTRCGAGIKPWTFQGYKGWRTPTLRWGIRDWRFLWETSGPVAASTWRQLAAYGGRTTRLDLQTTLRLSKPRPTFGSECFSPSREKARSTTSPRTVSGLSTDSRGLWFGRVGERTSERYFRVYDKGVEARTDPLGVRWRLELEAKGRLAQALTRELCDTPNEPKLCYERLVSSWKSEGFSWPVRGRAPNLPPIVRPKKPADSALGLAMWLQSSVRPVIERGLKVFTVWEMLQMIGMDTLAVPILPDETDRRGTGHD